MKRDWESDLESESSEETDDSAADEDYAPSARAAKKRKQSGGRHSNVAPRASKRTPKTPQAATKAATTTVAATTPAATAAAAVAAPAPSTATATVVAAAPTAAANATVAATTPATTTPAATTPAATTPVVAATPTVTVEEGRNADFSSAISVKARLPQCNLGAVEFLAFFPLHMQWPELGLRLYRNGWNSKVIAMAMLHARNKLDHRSMHAVEKRRSANRHQVISNGKYFFRDQNFTPSNNAANMTPVTSYDASNYAVRNTIRPSQLFTAKLVDIANGVKNWPMGKDCGLVTQVIMYAVRNGRDDLTTADIPTVAFQLGFQAPSESGGSRWDQNAYMRIRARIQLTGNCRGEPFEGVYADETDSDDEIDSDDELDSDDEPDSDGEMDA